MLRLRENLDTRQDGDTLVYLPAAAINSSDAKEFASNDRYEKQVVGKSPRRHLFDDLLFKSDFIRTFVLVEELLDVRPGHRVLELGASHGWASVMIKQKHPEAMVFTSDLVPDMVRHAAYYESALDVKLDGKWAFSVRDIPFADAQFDRIFTFASFHHFGDHGDYTESIRQIERILKPGGKLVLLYEPASPPWLYRFAFWRVNRRRAQEGVDEDVLVVSRLEAIAARLGLKVTWQRYPEYRYRGSVGSTMYYYLVKRLRLARFAVCTTNMIFQKPPARMGDGS